MATKDVIKKFEVELVEQLPLDNLIFFAKAKGANLFPSDVADNITARNTRADKVSYFLQHVIEPGVEDYLPKLLNVMKGCEFTNVKKLADDIQAAIAQSMCNNTVAQL